MANENKGRDCLQKYGSAEGASRMTVNLSGKKTLVGRNSGERLFLFIQNKPPKGKAFYIR
ncbi:hypothetical protein AAV98_07520 [Bacillus sp. CHD6a]|nr:hypothetical protein AAV98_07520 [Bacillus sp. CHD6a]